MKFAAVDDDARARIAAASEDELMLWGERILGANSLAAIFDA